MYGTLPQCHARAQPGKKRQQKQIVNKMQSENRSTTEPLT